MKKFVRLIQNYFRQYQPISLFPSISLILLISLFLTISIFQTKAQTLPIYKDENTPQHERIIDLLSKLTPEEKISLLIASSPGIPRLDIEKYYHGNEALHGIVRPGNFTVFHRLLHSQACGIQPSIIRLPPSSQMRRVPDGMNWKGVKNKHCDSTIY